jgi:hypothetical protein
MLQHVRDGQVAVAPGDVIAIHWGWSCGRLTRRQTHRLRSITALAMRRANETT